MNDKIMIVQLSFLLALTFYGHWIEARFRYKSKVLQVAAAAGGASQLALIGATLFEIWELSRA